MREYAYIGLLLTQRIKIMNGQWDKYPAKHTDTDAKIWALNKARRRFISQISHVCAIIIPDQNGLRLLVMSKTDGYTSWERQKISINN